MPALAQEDEAKYQKPKMLKKAKYFQKLQGAFDEYSKAFIVNADNVGSKQMQEIRIANRDDCLLVFGKNTQMKKAIRQKAKENPDLEKLCDHLVLNVGFVFVKGDLKETRDRILANKVPAPARAGSLAQTDVSIPPGLTGMEPTQTSFFQALNIPTKINRGQIEIMSEVHLFKAGDKVTSSEVALLTKMKIKPFSYGLVFEQVYDNGTVYSPDVLDITQERLQQSIQTGLANIASISLTIGHPTKASAPHSIMNGLKNVVAISLATEYVCKPAEKIKAILDDPEALAAMTAAAAAPAAGGDDKKEEAAAEESEEESEAGSFDLFD